jgi:Flp pilus assembly protein TadB
MANKGLVWGILSFVIFIAVVALAVVCCWWYNRREKRKVKAVEQNLAIQRATQAARNELEKTASRRSQAKQTSSSYGEIERGDWR